MGCRRDVGQPHCVSRALGHPGLERTRLQAIQIREQHLFNLLGRICTGALVGLQGWLGLHGPLLQKLAVQRQLWTDIATTVNPADMSAPLHAALVQTSFASAAEAGHRAWEGVMGDLSQMYRMLVQQV